MTEYNVIVARIIDRSKSWQELGDLWHTNIEKVQGLEVGLDALLNVTRLIREGKVTGRQVDWGAWLAEVTKEQLLELYPVETPPTNVELYRRYKPGLTDEEIRTRMNFNTRERLHELPEGEYLLVGCEGPPMPESVGYP